MTTICFFSDLHMLSRRSNASPYFPLLKRMASESDIVVLGGDIFDFKWSTEVSLEASIQKAIGWTRDFASDSPGTQFSYLLGNHDCILQFVIELESLANSMANLSVEPYFVRFGDTVCLHGDVTDRLTTQATLEQNRKQWGIEKTRSSRWRLAYDTAVALRLHRLVAMAIHRPQRVAERLLFYLESHHLAPATGLRQVIFGHTHQPMDWETQGVRFRNGGAAIKGLEFEPIQFEAE